MINTFDTILYQRPKPFDGIIVDDPSPGPVCVYSASVATPVNIPDVRTPGVGQFDARARDHPVIWKVGPGAVGIDLDGLLAWVNDVNVVDESIECVRAVGVEMTWMGCVWARCIVRSAMVTSEAATVTISVVS